jgi:hypothetical protein
MIDILFATTEENDHTGYASVVCDRNANPTSYDSKALATKSGRTDRSAFWTILNVLENAPTDRDLRIFFDEDESAIEHRQDEIREWLIGRGHPEVEIHCGPPPEDNFAGTDISFETALRRMKRQSRAAAWGVTLNENAIVPGPKISGVKAQTLHKIAHRHGFEKGAFRLFLSEYGIISASEVTEAIYSKVKTRLSSKVVAEIYNKKYFNKTGQLAPASA